MKINATNQALELANDKLAEADKALCQALAALSEARSPVYSEVAEIVRLLTKAQTKLSK